MHLHAAGVGTEEKSDKHKDREPLIFIEVLIPSLYFYEYANWWEGFKRETFTGGFGRETFQLTFEANRLG